jgi:hypothetical protein
MPSSGYDSETLAIGNCTGSRKFIANIAMGIYAEAGERLITPWHGICRHFESMQADVTDNDCIQPRAKLMIHV